MSAVSIVGGWLVRDVTLVTDTSAYASGDVLVIPQEVKDVTRTQAGYSMLSSLMLIDQDDQGAAMDVYFWSANVTLGTINTAPSISDADAIYLLARVSVSTSDWIDLGGVRVAEFNTLNRVLKAADGTNSVYVSVINGTGTPTFTASGLKLRMGVILD